VFEIGTSLREARLRQGYEFADAEAATKIRSKYLRALEEERFELLPAQTYVKGFLHSYAEYLGLDGQLYVDEYNSRHVSGEDELAPRPRRRPAAPSRAHRRVESRMVLLALFGIAALTAFVVVAWKAGDSEPPPIPNLDASPPAAGTQAGQTQPAAGQQRPRPAALSIAAVRGSSSLTINKESARGELVYAGTLEQGKSLSFTWRQLWIEAASPENLRIRLNGQVVQLPGNPSAPATVIVTADGVRPAGQG
jgi:cytoskeleton protein RodZ